MEFPVVERMMLLKLLEPVEGDVTMLRVVRSLQERIGFTAEEREKLNFKQTATQVLWKGDADVPLEIEFSPGEREIIASQLKLVSEARKLTLPQLNLYDKFVEGEDPDEEKGE